jgi:hypothetical protein
MVSTRGQLDAPLLDVSQVEQEFWERKEVTLHSLAKFNKPKGWKKYVFTNRAPKIVLKRLTAKEWDKIDLKFYNLKVELSKSAPIYHRVTEKSLAGKDLTKKELLLLGEAKVKTLPIYIGMLELMIEKPKMDYEQVLKLWDCLDSYDQDTLSSIVNMLTSEKMAVTQSVNQKRLAELDGIKAEAMSKYGR